MKNIFPIVIIAFLMSCNNSNKPSTPSLEQLVTKGQSHLKSNQIDSAIIIYQKAIEIFPDKPDGYYGIGLIKAIYCHRDSSYCSESISYLEKVLIIEPNHEKALFNIGICYTSIGRYMKSVEYFNKAIAQDSTNGQYFCNRGYSKLLLNDLNGACEDFYTALNLGAYKAKDYLIYCGK